MSRGFGALAAADNGTSCAPALVSWRTMSLSGCTVSKGLGGSEGTVAQALTGVPRMLPGQGRRGLDTGHRDTPHPNAGTEAERGTPASCHPPTDKAVVHQPEPHPPRGLTRCRSARGHLQPYMRQWCRDPVSRARIDTCVSYASALARTVRLTPGDHRQEPGRRRHAGVYFHLSARASPRCLRALLRAEHGGGSSWANWTARSP